MKHLITECFILKKESREAWLEALGPWSSKAGYQQTGRLRMLRLTVSTEEYLMIGDNVKIVFLGGTKNHLRIMVDAPKDVNIVRSTVLENRVTDPEEKAKLPKYYAESETDPKYLKKKKSRVVITHGNLED